jgi:osomolarity two-component system response regulator SKN7
MNGAASEVPPGLQVFTVGHLLPRSSTTGTNGTWSFDPSSLQLVQPSSSYTSAPPKRRAPTPQRLRVRRSTFVPGWAVPPRVLLVDDDAVSRKLSSKFLQVFGCTIDVAVDGIGAVNKMNLEKYDLVLMVRLHVHGRDCHD